MIMASPTSGCRGRSTEAPTTRWDPSRWPPHTYYRPSVIYQYSLAGWTS